MITPPWSRKNQPKVAHTTSARIDVKTVMYCSLCRTCMLRVDLDEKGKCGRCHMDVQDVTHSPMGQAWLAFLRPTASG
jgi:hypothetical protein